MPARPITLLDTTPSQISSFTPILLQTLFGPEPRKVRSPKSQLLCNQANPNSFARHPGWDISSGSSQTFTPHSPIDFLVLYSHGLTNCFFHNSFILIIICVAPCVLGVPSYQFIQLAILSTWLPFKPVVLPRLRATIGSRSARTSPFHERHNRMPQDGTRRSGRIPKQVAISLFGSDFEGRVFSERTKTVVLSRYGAGIVSSYKLSAEQELVIRSEASHKEIEARVVGQIGSKGDTYIYGIAFLDRTINFWDIDFPDLSDMEKLASKTLLECSSCQSREMADHSDLASDVMAVNDSIMRYCQKCGYSTLWKQAAPGSTPSREMEERNSPAASPTAESFRAAAPPGALDVEGHQLNERQLSGGPAKERSGSFASPALMKTETFTHVAALDHETSGNYSSVRDDGILTAGDLGEEAKPDSPCADASKPEVAISNAAVAVKDRENRRKHARTRVNFKACVRRPGLADDVVACEDMSRGGLRFKSNRKYFEKMLIDVAVPYSPGGQAIFVAAQIVYVRELPEQNTYRCGVMYLRSSAR